MRRSLTAAALALVLGALAVAIVLSQGQARSHLTANFALRGRSSATFVSTFLAQQADRERSAAQQFLSEKHVSLEHFEIVAAAFGSHAAVLLDGAGRLLAVLPAKPSLLGQPIAARYAHLAAAERGSVAVSNVVPSAARGAAVTAIAVPFATPQGRRVFSAAYPASGTALEALVDHTISYRQHQVFLVDADEHLIAASPSTGASTLAEVDPQLARAVARSTQGSVPGGGTPATFTLAQVPGTSWRLIIAVPDSRLYASVTGWTRLVPWLVFALVALFGAMLVVLFDRLQADRTRLAVLSAQAARTARTDSLTGLYNRLALTEHLTRAAAHARRRGEPLSVLMIDLDRFKETNDRFGHEAGDRVLCAIADCMRAVLRAEDLYGRWGGDELVVVLPYTDAAGAAATAMRMREAAAAVNLAEIGLARGVPLSVGVATGVHAAPEDLIREADLALYADKARRRETARPADGPHPPMASPRALGT